eukprot:gnl/MRDRNA2_/MRDRNA2_205410_c0_seq1.p1 gnl/MRDRNA2_/MRDRNA2_205410_c0~~gnl/MRDRNA2_/MRDRNA2_205410_c0_seq1.p1  ORF type:complete len:321 (-),score=50.51 gnl/MRDRNA2_/MRDRNA2_205410_c0_seq1:68-1030(-)
MQRLEGLRNTPRRLAAHQIKSFDRDGFLFPLSSGLSAADMISLRNRIETAEKESQKAGMGLFLNAHLKHKWWHSICTRPEILDVVEDLLGRNILIWKSQLWIKEPNNQSFVGWHQDATYWGLEPPDSVNVWMAVTDVMPSNGPLELLAGSHQAALPTKDTYTADNILTRGQDIDWNSAGGLDMNKVAHAVLKPGEFSVHHLCTPHASQPNQGPGRRIGFNITFVAPHVLSVRSCAASAMLVRGMDMVGNWEHEVPPQGDVPTPTEAAAMHAKNEGQTLSLLADADMARFQEVLQARSTRNLPSHVKSGGEGAFQFGLSKL